MNSQIRIKKLVTIFDYEIILKGSINYWYGNPAKYCISYSKYHLKNTKIIFRL